MPATLGEIADRFGCRLRGDPEVAVSSVAALARAGAQSISFFANPGFRAQLAITTAAAVILAEEHATECPVACLVHPNPYATFARVAAFLHPRPLVVPGVHPTASIAATAKVAESASIGAHAAIAEEAVIGEDVTVGAGCIVGAGSVVGTGTWLAPRVVLMDRVRVGERCIIHSGAVLGADGFGFAMDDGHWVKVPQLGGVTIGSDVEIGANTTVDRGTIDDTLIGNGVKLDNLVQIAHNVRIGDHVVMAAMSGVAGSSIVGARCMIGGGAVLINHISICDDVTILFRSVVTKSIKTPGVFSGAFPAASATQWRRSVARFRQLDKLGDRLKLVEEKLRTLVNGRQKR